MPEEKNKEYKALVAELRDTVKGYQEDVKDVKSQSADFKQKLDKINEAMDNLDLQMKNNAPEPSPEAKAAAKRYQFNRMIGDFARHNEERKSLPDRYKKSIDVEYHPSLRGADSEVKADNIVRFDVAQGGALLMPASIQRGIIKDITETTPVMQYARVTPVAGSQLIRRRRTSRPGGVWLAEGKKNEKNTPEWALIKMEMHKWASRYGIHIEGEEDLEFDFVSEMQEQFREDSEADFGTAFMKGDGVGKPTGMIGRVDNLPSEQLFLDSDLLIKIQEELKSPYQNNAVWLMPRKTRGYVRTVILSEGSDLNGAWEPDLTRRTPTRLLGNPVAIAAEGDLASRHKGNFEVGSVPLIYGDLRSGYEIGMGRNMYMIDDPYSEADHFTRNLHVMTRITGGVVKKEAVKQLTMTNS